MIAQDDQLVIVDATVRLAVRQPNAGSKHAC